MTSTLFVSTILIVLLYSTTVSSDCIDTNPKCGDIVHLCQSKAYQTFLFQQCKKTCKFCGPDCEDVLGE